MTALDETVGLLGDLIAFPTVSSESNLALIDWAAERLAASGARLRRVGDDTGAKANLFATFGPEGDGGLVLSGHTDVVPVADQVWSSDPFEMVARGDRLYGRGTADMKGFIACLLAMAPEFGRAALTRPVHFALTHDEETGCFGAQAMLAALIGEGLRPSAAIIGEPTMMRVIEGHKGSCHYTTEFTGLEGHDAIPGLGVNAVEYAVRYAARLMEIADRLRAEAPEGRRFVPPWATLGIGRLAGGVAHNVIPGSAELEWEVRSVGRDDAERVKAEIDGYAEEVLVPAMRAISEKAGIRRLTLCEVDALEVLEENEARRIVAELTGANRAEVVSFCTEAGVMQRHGMDCVVCGPGDIAQAHKPDEYIETGQLALCLDMLERLVRRLSAPGLSR